VSCTVAGMRSTHDETESQAQTTTRGTDPASMQALLGERRRQAAESPDSRREGMPAALQARDNLRRRLDAGDGVA
jgi:hypothetical protein